MPPGLRIDQATGIISGIPTRPNSYTVTASARNAAGESETLTFDLNIYPMPDGVVGAYQGPHRP